MNLPCEVTTTRKLVYFNHSIPANTKITLVKDSEFSHTYYWFNYKGEKYLIGPDAFVIDKKCKSHRLTKIFQ